MVDFALEEIGETDIESLSFSLSPVIEDKKPVHYINNKELQEEFVRYHEMKEKWIAEGKDGRPQLTPKIAQAIMDISRRRIYSSIFINYSQDWKEEMVGDAIEICCRYIHNYNPTKYNNPFAYITQSVTNAIKNRIKIEKKMLYTKYKAFENMGGYQAFSDEMLDNESSEAIVENHDMFNNYREFIDDYESRMEAKNAKTDTTLDSSENNLLKFVE